MERKTPTSQVAGTMNQVEEASTVPLDMRDPRKHLTDHLNAEDRNMGPLAMVGSVKAPRDTLPVMVKETKMNPTPTQAADTMMNLRKHRTDQQSRSTVLLVIMEVVVEITEALRATPPATEKVRRHLGQKG